MGKVNYFCTTCGKGFTTGNAARRHIRTVEQGAGIAVTEASYAVGLRTGVFSPALPGKPPKFEIKRRPRDKPPVVIESDEFIRGFWRRAGELLCEEMFKDPKKRMEIHKQFEAATMRAINEIRMDDMAENVRDAAIKSTAETARTFFDRYGSWFKDYGRKGA